MVGRRGPGPPDPAGRPSRPPALGGASPVAPLLCRRPPTSPPATPSGRRQTLSVPGSSPSPPTPPSRCVPRVARRSPSPLGGEGPGSAGAWGGGLVAGLWGEGRGREGGRGPGGDVGGGWRGARRRATAGVGSPRHGPGSAEVVAASRGRAANAGPASRRGAAGRVPRRSTARLSSSSLQVPSAFRRGGLKTPGGSPVRLGSGADGPVGSRAAWPSSPTVPVAPPGRGGRVRAQGPRGDAGRGSPARRPSSGLARVPRPLRAFPGRPETPGRLWGSRARPRGGGRPCGTPSSTLPTPRSLVSSFVVGPAGGQPPSVGRTCRADPRKTKNSYDS